jgi:hypothetical protein
MGYFKLSGQLGLSGRSSVIRLQGKSLQRLLERRLIDRIGILAVAAGRGDRVCHCMRTRSVTKQAIEQNRLLQLSQNLDVCRSAARIPTVEPDFGSRLAG